MGSEGICGEYATTQDVGSVGMSEGLMRCG